MTPPTAAARVARLDEAFEDAGLPGAVAAKPHLRAVEDAPAAAPILWRDDAFVADEWTVAKDGESVAEGPAILPLARFLAEREALASRNAPLGVIVAPGEKLDELVPHLDAITLVALPFPKFNDGRSSSTARLLRERYGFKGELRAVGNVLRDQALMMTRAGFDAFAFEKAADAEAFGKALATYSHFYQPTGDGRATARDVRTGHAGLAPVEG